jgi:hypothetical protein
MPRTKTDLLHHIQQGWAGLEQTISQLSAGRMSTHGPSGVAPGIAKFW